MRESGKEYCCNTEKTWYLSMLNILINNYDLSVPQLLPNISDQNYLKNIWVILISGFLMSFSKKKPLQFFHSHSYLPQQKKSKWGRNQPLIRWSSICHTMWSEIGVAGSAK